MQLLSDGVCICEQVPGHFIWHRRTVKASLLYQICSRDTEFLHDNEVSRIVTRGQECVFGLGCAGVSAGCGQTHTSVPE